MFVIVSSIIKNAVLVNESESAKIRVVKIVKRAKG